MSGAPTSGGDAATLGALLTAGWIEAEFVWERRQERAAELAASEGQDQAAALWAKALSLAREHFTDNDPRLATSLANHAHALRQAGDEVAARRLFEDALRVWDGSGPWVAALKPERRARSSTFHLRLEAKHPGGYDGHSQERFRSLASDGRTALRALSVGAGPAFDGLARWHGEQPDGFTDGRKLLAAVCLIAAAQ